MKKVERIDFDNINDVVRNYCLEIAELSTEVLNAIVNTNTSLLSVITYHPDAQDYELRSILFDLNSVCTLDTEAIPYEIMKNSEYAFELQQMALQSLESNAREILANPSLSNAQSAQVCQEEELAEKIESLNVNSEIESNPDLPEL